MLEIPFPEKKYDVIYADPPWSYNDKMTGHKIGAATHYETQDLQWIKTLPVAEISAKDAALFLWVVSPQLQEGLDVISSWGFKYKTIAFVWSKHTKTGKKVYNMGRWTMGNVELCLLGVKGKPNSWREDLTIKQLIEAERFRHSQKPVEARIRIEKMLGDRSRIELFARQKSAGWDAWGNDPVLLEKANEN